METEKPKGKRGGKRAGAGAKPKIIDPVKLEEIMFDPVRVEAMGGRYMTKKEVCHILGICYDTLEKNIKQNAKIEEIMQRGKAKNKLVLTSVMFDNAVKGKNVVAGIFLLKTQYGFKETNVMETLNLTAFRPNPNCTQEEAEEAYRRLSQPAGQNNVD